jgi:hypothetical protein
LRLTLLTLFAFTWVALVAAPSGLAAKGGNSDNAKLCQKGGWERLVRSDGSSFARGGECTRYAARGGTLEPKHVLAGQQVCAELGGVFGHDEQTPGDGSLPGYSLFWTCNDFPFKTDGDFEFFVLIVACLADGGVNGSGLFGPTHADFSCYRL